MTDFSLSSDLRIVRVAEAKEAKAPAAEPTPVVPETLHDLKEPRSSDDTHRSTMEHDMQTEPDETKHEHAHNLLVIADSDMGADLKLAAFSHCVEWKSELFLNRSLSDIVKRTPFLWFNLRRSGCREYVMRNISGCPYNILLCYSDAGAPWLDQLKEANPDAVLIKRKKLCTFDSLSEMEILEQLLTTVVRISKPDSKFVKAVKFIFGCIIKK